MAKLTLFYKGRMIRSYELDDQLFVVGRTADCDICIDSFVIAEQHARVKPDKESYRIEQAREEAVLLVNHTPETSVLLRHGDVIQIGEHTIFFSETPAAINATEALKPQRVTVENSKSDNKFDHIIKSISRLPAGCIQVLSGPHIGKMIPLQRSLTRLGLTGNNCAVIAHRDDGYFLSHLEGKSTPLVNDQTIGNSSTHLRDGCIIQIGDIRVRFHQEALQRAVL
ncbi:MAG: FHA domain-containing protein [Candidatus Sedimenticola sp. (ex Thyasira tokunagai)]